MFKNGPGKIQRTHEVDLPGTNRICAGGHYARHAGEVDDVGRPHFLHEGIDGDTLGNV